MQVPGRPRGTCLASARRSAANSLLKLSRGNCSTTYLRIASGISLLREPRTSSAAPADMILVDQGQR